MTPSRIDKHFVETPKGRIAYLEAGSRDRPALLLVHGIPTSCYLWRDVVAMLSGDFHCLAPDLMGLGDTLVDPDRTDFSMPSQAEMLEDFLDALGIERAHLVAHDQGGAAAQILAVRRTSRLDRLVLTDCVCYDNWPVPAIARLQALARLPLVADLANRSGLMQWLETSTPWSRFRKGLWRPDALSRDSIEEYLRPVRGSADERRRFMRFLLAGHARYTMAVAGELRALRTPTMILWAADDRYISPSWGRKLYDDIPGAECFELVPFTGHFWQEERPAEFASRIQAFLLAGARATPRETRRQGRDGEPAHAPGATTSDAAEPGGKLYAIRRCPRPRAKKEVDA
jgi:pimeloyl-ACP methyl ester carboxylesterase